MKVGDTASYGHVALHGYENSLRVNIEVLDTRREDHHVDRFNYIEQWYLEVTGYDRKKDEDVVTREVVISIIEKDPTEKLAFEDWDQSFETLIWVVDDPDYWTINHDKIVSQYSVYDRRETITNAILSMIEDIHRVF